MAVKKVTKSTENNVEVKDEVLVETENTEVEDTTAGEETSVEEEITVDTEVEETPVVSVEETESVPAKKSKANRIKMRVDHNCYIGGEWYYLKKGQCYNVDDNVKSILDGAGLLAPL